MLVESTVEVLSRLKNEPALFMFSCGKDSLAMLDIAMKTHINNFVFVFCYFAEKIPSREKIITYYEKKYKIKIERRLSWYGESAKTGKRVNQGIIYSRLREEFNRSYIVEGIKPTDSIIRNAMIKKSDLGIDVREMRAYPMYRWYDKAVMAYIKNNKLLLPIEYQANAKHDLSNMNLEALSWTKINLPGDYRVIIDQYPRLESLLKHKEMYRGT